MADGSTYKGEFEDDMMHGSGFYKFASGNLYKGEFKSSWRWSLAPQVDSARGRAAESKHNLSQI